MTNITYVIVKIFIVKIFMLGMYNQKVTIFCNLFKIIIFIYLLIKDF